MVVAAKSMAQMVQRTWPIRARCAGFFHCL